MENFMAFGKMQIPGDPGAGVLNAVGPGIPAQFISQAAAVVWLLLPTERRTPEEIAAALHAMVDRAVLALVEDDHFFAKTDRPSAARKGEIASPPSENVGGQPQ